jgi:hypothetical protein
MRPAYIEILKAVCKVLQKQKTLTRKDIINNSKVSKSSLSRAINNIFKIENITTKD